MSETTPKVEAVKALARKIRREACYYTRADGNLLAWLETDLEELWDAAQDATWAERRDDRDPS